MDEARRFNPSDGASQKAKSGAEKTKKKGKNLTLFGIFHGINTAKGTSF